MSATVVGNSNVLNPKSFVVNAPSGRSAVLMIASREVTEQLASFRFLIITFLVIGLTPLAVYVGARDYFSRLGDYNRLETRKQKIASGDAGKAVTGVDDPFADESDNIVLRAIRPPEPLSVLVHGLDGALPEYWDFSATGIISGTSATRPQRLADVLGTLDLEFLVRVALGLLAILLAFDAVAGEKELGTLRAVLSQPISRAALLTGKLLGGMITLILPLAGAFLIALITAQVLHVGLLDSANLARVGLLAVTSALYLVCFYALGLFVSSLVRSQKTSLVFLLVIWVVSVLAVPPLATLIAQAVAPTDPAHVIEARKRQADDDIRKQSERSYGEVYRAATGLPVGWMDTSKYIDHKQEIDSKLAPMIVSYISKRRQLINDIDRDAELR